MDLDLDLDLDLDFDFDFDLDLDRSKTKSKSKTRNGSVSARRMPGHDHIARYSFTANQARSSVQAASGRQPAMAASASKARGSHL